MKKRVSKAEKESKSISLEIMLRFNNVKNQMSKLEIKTKEMMTRFMYTSNKIRMTKMRLGMITSRQKLNFWGVIFLWPRSSGNKSMDEKGVTNNFEGINVQRFRIWMEGMLIKSKMAGINFFWSKKKNVNKEATSKYHSFSV